MPRTLSNDLQHCYFYLCAENLIANKLKLVLKKKMLAELIKFKRLSNFSYIDAVGMHLLAFFAQ
jgi:hypothetical protein